MRIILLVILFIIMPAGYSTAADTDQLVIMHEGEPVKIVDPDTYTFSLFLHETRLEQLMAELDEMVYKNPVDASLDEKGGIISAKPGQALDRASFQLAFLKSVYQGSKAEIDIPLKRIYPRVDNELLSVIREHKIGSYATHFQTGNKERSHNIRLASEAIDNEVIFPGETFSFNKIVGKRTEEKGYKRAPVIVKGELSEDIGGGICQTSSTLYNAVDLEGIEIIERYSHSRRVPYVPPGRDATVSWWGPDFSFKNKRHQPILIRSKAENGRMEISIYSAAK